MSNLTLACHTCNQKKGNRTAAEFGHPSIQAKAKQPLKDAASVNATRWTLWRRLGETGLPVECGTGGRTKYNRVRAGLPKAHYLDAACVGESGAFVVVPATLKPLGIKAMGHGRRQRCMTDKYGFPKSHAKRAKQFMGWQTGDIARDAGALVHERRFEEARQLSEPVLEAVFELLSKSAKQHRVRKYFAPYLYLPNRPFHRLAHALVLAYCGLSQLEKAQALCRRMLALWPNDNIGFRFIEQDPRLEFED